MKGKKVNSNETLLRRSYFKPLTKYLNQDGTATSRAFSLRENDFGKLSLDVKSMTTLQKSIKDTTKYILFEMDVVHVEFIGFCAIHDPIPDNIAHAFIEMDDDDDITPGLLARSSRRVHI